MKRYPDRPDDDMETPLSPTAPGLLAKTASSVTDSQLWNFNLAGLILHGTQGTAMLVASQAVSSIKNFRKELTTSFLEFDDNPESPTYQTLIPGIRNAGKVEIGLMAAVFVLMSAVAHAWVLIFWKTYLGDIARETNRARWYEYALSSSVMICAIAVLFGCYDLGSLILMFLINVRLEPCPAPTCSCPALSRHLCVLRALPHHRRP